MTDFEPEGYVEAHPDIFGRLERLHHTARDGTFLYYEAVGSGDRTVVLANGLGARLYTWLPLVSELRHDFRILTWDYRGLFKSASEVDRRRLGVRDHAEDLRELLDAEGVSQIDLVGWSMGVQVALEFLFIHPDRVRSLTLINGTYGDVFASALQPQVQVPGAQTVIHHLVEWLIGRPRLTSGVGRALSVPMEAVWKAHNLLRHERQSLLILAARQYLRDVWSTNFENFLRLCQEVDAHSVYHLLPLVTVPTLVISGGCDILTPAYLSKRMAKRIPGATHAHFRLATHFVVLERPETVIRLIRDHLREP